jgi:hypothetical protein
MEHPSEPLTYNNLNDMKKINIIVTILIFLLLAAVESCKKEPKIGGTAVQMLAGEWWVKIDNGSDPTGDFGPGYYNFSTYNTAANIPDSMWVDDDNNAKSFWDIKGRVHTDVSNLSFSGNNIENQDYNSTFTITNGKVILHSAKASGTKDVVDSISFDITFSDDPTPGTVHKVGGYKRTGFSQDDH